MIDHTHLITEGIKAMKAARNELRIKWINNTDWDIDPQLWDEYQAREWHFDLQRRFKLHPVVAYMLTRYEPANWQQLLLEWPHIAETDPARMAYTRDESHGKADRQTLTSVGKYIKRHWPQVADHHLRDAQATYHPDTITIVEGIQELIIGIEFGPRSCMQSAYGNIPFTSDDHLNLKRWLVNGQTEVDWESHPYAVYLPEYGWKMVIRKDSEGKILGRCIVNTNGKIYVRSYKRAKDDESTSEADHVIEAWLNDNGWTKVQEWPEGLKLAALEHPCEDGPLLPYIDGSGLKCRRVALSECGTFFVRDNDGPHDCSNTDGTSTYYAPVVLATCARCEDEYDEDEGRETLDGVVCPDCFENYTDAVVDNGEGGRRYVIAHVEDTTRVYSSYTNYDMGCRSTPVVDEAVPDNYVYIESCSCYCPIDYAVRCTDEEWYFQDDPNIVKLAEYADGYRYAPEDETWKDAYGYYHHNSIESMEIDGLLYKEDDCVQCDLTGIWYKPGTKMWELDSGEISAAEAFERVSSDAEWGDSDTNEVRIAERKEAAEKEEASSKMLKEVSGLSRLVIPFFDLSGSEVRVLNRLLSASDDVLYTNP